MYLALYVAAGKRGKQSLVVASNCNNSTGRLYETDRASKTSFLFDVGDRSVCLSTLPSARTQDTFQLWFFLQLTALPSVHMGALICVWISAYGGSFHDDF